MKVERTLNDKPITKEDLSKIKITNPAFLDIYKSIVEEYITRKNEVKKFDVS